MALDKEKEGDDAAHPFLGRDAGCLRVKEGRVEGFDSRAAEVLRVTDPTGLQLFELLVPESWNEVRIAIEQVARKERETESVLACLKDDETWLNITVQEADLSGRIVLFLDRMGKSGGAEGPEMKSRHHFHALVKNSSEGFTIFDEEANIVYESPANERIHGYQAHEVMGRNLFDFCVEEDRERIMPLFRDLRPGGRATGTVRFRHKEGHYIHLEGTIHQQLEHPSIRGIINNFRDITSRIEAEAELLRAKESAERAIEVQKRFLTNISHELKTPLTLVRQPLQDLRKAAESSGENRDGPLLWPLVERNLDQLSQLITKLLDLSRLETGLFRLQVHQLDLTPFIEEVASVFAPSVRAKRIELTLELPESAPAFFDAGKMEEAIRNLLANALKFTAAGGRISVRLRPPPENALHPQYTLEFEDTGCGMDEVTSQRAFDRFFQGESGDNRPFEGMGVGLSLARAMARMHGGDLSVRSQLGVGSTFVLTLPAGCRHLSPEEIDLLKEPSEVERTSPEEFPKALASDREGENIRRFHLLLVEDNRDMRSYLAHHLSEIFNLSQASNGKEALERLHEGGIDLVLSDVMMPIMGGVELCRAMKNNDEGPPVILLSAKSTGEDKTAGLEAGAADYISKPFFMPEVLKRIQRLLPEEEENELHPADRRWLETASANIGEVLSVQDLALEDMARLSGLGAREFERKLRHLAGESPRSFLKNLRLKRVHDLIRENPEKPIENIASEVGLTPEFLKRAYRNHYGEEPIPAPVTL